MNEAVAVAVAVVAVGAAASMPAVIARFAPVDGGQPRLRVPTRSACMALTAALVVPTVLRLRAEPAWLPAYAYLVLIGVVLTVVDLRVHRLPDGVTLPSYPALAALLGLATLDGDWERWPRALLAGAVVTAIFAALWALPTGIGLGDVKMSGLLGMALGWFGWGYVAEGMLLGVVLGGLGALVLLVTRRVGRGDWIAYGPYLLAGTLLAILLGRPTGGS